MLTLLASLTLAPGAAGECPPPGMSKASLMQLEQNGSQPADDEDRDRLAVALLGCLGDPDPKLRDGIAFAAISRWARAKELAPSTLETLADELIVQLRESDDPGGFRRPFAALVLSEVVRADRLDPALGTERRRVIAELAASYLRQVTDYRGFDAVEGWRHGVAHGADLALQLAVHPEISKPQVQKLLDAVKAQVAPPGAVFYIYGEPERLARVVFFTHRRGILTREEWSAWIASIAAPQPLQSWGEAFGSQEGLARRHNTLAFLLATLFAGRVADDEAGAELARLAEEALKKVHGE